MTGGERENKDASQIESFLKLLHKPGDVFELRIFECPEQKGRSYKRTASGYFTDIQAAARQAIIYDVLEPPGVYVTLNPVDPELLARSNNRVTWKAEKTTADAQITCRKFIVIDIDPVRASGISSTDEEMQAAVNLAREISYELEREGWPTPLLGMSGNGAYALYRAELPNNDDSTALVKGVLAGLHERFSTAQAVIDTSTFNASRVIKLFGTTARKGDDFPGTESLPARPHRKAYFWPPEDELKPVPRELLEACRLRHSSQEPATRDCSSSAHQNGTKARQRWQSYVEKIPDAIEGEKGSNPTFQAACECYRFGMSEGEAWEAMQWFNDNKSQPPWSDKDLRHKLEDARKQVERDNEFGCRLTEPELSREVLRKGSDEDDSPCIRDAEKKVERGVIRRETESGKQIVVIGTDEHSVVTQTVAALGRDDTIFQRGGLLVRVIREHRQDNSIRRESGSTAITFLPQAALRERMTKYIEFTQFVRQGKKFAEVPTHPTQWLVAAVDARGEWPGIRTLKGVSDVPVLRADGSLWQTPGYDERTGVLYEPSESFPPIADDATIGEAQAALTELLDVVCDFQFESSDHRAAWLAGLLTPLARFAFDGPAPFFLIDANTRGAGKGLLAQTIGQIVMGREMPVSSYAHNPEEMRKKITAIAIAGDRMVHLDNLEGDFGNDTLDRALTASRWKDRILGTNQEVDLPLIPVWYGTGNNVAVAADTTRRIIHIRLDVLAEKPEERTGFKHPELILWIKRNRPRLLTSALTILRAFCNAGMPRQSVSAFGSFEGWSRLVRESIVWVGQPDPCATRTKLAEQSDTTADALGQLIAAWSEVDPYRNGIVVSDLLNRLYSPSNWPSDAAATAMRAALESIVGCPPGKVPSPRQVGSKFKHFRRRTVGGAYLDTNPNEPRRNGAVWRLHHA